MARFVGIDMGAEALKVVELERENSALTVSRRALVEHHKEPGKRLLEILGDWSWEGVTGAAVTGRLGRQVQLTRVPVKQAQAAAHRFLHGDAPATLVCIGSHGFSVLELRDEGREVFRENSRCAQGTGNFLRQLVERFDLGVEEAAELAAAVDQAAPLSGRCPVILKTDMTHLANKGEGKDRILAGLLDAICENVEVLVKPRLSPPRVFLSGGVARASRVRRHFQAFLARHGMELVDTSPDEGLYLEALGCALAAAEHAGTRVPPLSELALPALETTLEKLPPLSTALARVKRMSLPADEEATPTIQKGAQGQPEEAGPERPGGMGGLERSGGPTIQKDAVLGFDIGSTGSKAVLLDRETRQPLWESYLRTNGSPVGAAQELMRRFLESPAASHRVRGFGATGSGREIVGSLLATVYRRESVYVLNEIAAHATGALHLDPRVDTIFEIGGQDAKYIRLAEGRVVDAAMNEACSAGTGSFIEEQGKRFHGIEDVAQLGREALAAPDGVALGQHCSVFMAEIIDEALASGVARDRIVAGIYDSVVANYLNRVKGSRSVGQVVFCQGMPFASDALAAAVARQTGAEVIVPPKPGLMGAIGIALLALDDLPLDELAPADGRLFLAARVDRKDQFLCGATQGCGGSGNKCRIDRLTTLVAGEKQRFTWGGGCSLWDQGTRKRKLPDLAPDPFREREALVAGLTERLAQRGDRPVVAMTDEFQLKGLFPFFATFVHALGLDLQVTVGADRKALKRGIEEANVPFCAPMQQYHGLVAEMAEAKPDFLFLPMLREIPRVSARERVSAVCPIVQGAPDMLRWDLGASAPRILSPVFDMGEGFLESEPFLESCRALAAELGVKREGAWRAAWRGARAEQQRFDDALLAMGERALTFCRERGITPVVVVGRSYTIHNDVLNSNVPSIVREQGAIAIPLDCYPVPDDVPVFEDVFWGYGQRILRAAWHLRRQPGVYSVFCSNYSCGPDSFTVHAYVWLMEGRPFAIIETDGHAGDAGTKTRVEAFLHCVREDQRRAGATPPRSGKRLTVPPQSMLDLARRRERMLVPRMGPEAEAVAAALRGAGARAETLPTPTRETLRLGRRHTSGKECLPLTLTVGSLLERIERPEARAERFTLVMPGSDGPCRFGAYKQIHQLVLARLGHGERVRLWSPPFGDYFQGMPPGFKAVIFAGVVGAGVLEQALHDVRPVETRDGAANEIHRKWSARLWRTIEECAAGDLSATKVLLEIASGRVYGIPGLLRQAAMELAAVKGQREVPNVLVVGEIYVRSDPFANDFVSEALERRGIRARIEPVSEFIQYSDHVAFQNGSKRAALDRVESVLRSRVVRLCHEAGGDPLGLGEHAPIPAVLGAAASYLREELEVESVLTVGLPVHAWRQGEIDAVVSVGPLECMPNKIAEAQFHHVAEREGLLSLTLSLNGDPVDPEVLDGFAFEVHQRFRKRGHPAAGPPSWKEKLGVLLKPAVPEPAAEE
jgi:predicted CoA-substrate-specific enzyme activase